MAREQLLDAGAAGHWYWRPTVRDGEPALEVVHTRTGQVVTSTHASIPRAAKLANALNRAYGATDAPAYDEETGAVIERRIL